MNITTEIIIDRFVATHGPDSYDYSEVIYVDAKTKIKIICNKCNYIFWQTVGNHSNGHGCSNCAKLLRAAYSKNTQFTTKIIINKFIEIWGTDKFNYTEVNYTGMNKKVWITCNSCNNRFFQVASSHLNGIGCANCSGKKKLTHDKFIEKSNIKHNFKYKYLSLYIDTKAKIEIECPDHGLFTQIAGNHMYGQGCPKCSITNNSKNNTFSKSEVIIIFNLKHGIDKFDYTEVNYTGMNEKIIIKCNLCKNKFEQTASTHAAGHGCPKCAIMERAEQLALTHEQFVNKSNIKHNFKYKYLSKYINSKSLISIECPDHGIFKQSPSNHLSGSGCPKCVKTISKKEIEWLDYIGIDNKYRQTKISIDNKVYKVDAYNPNTNTIYEFYGNYWHGNPKIHNINDINAHSKKTFGELYQKTIDRENSLKIAGYTLITIWESDWNILKKIGKKGDY